MRVGLVHEFEHYRRMMTLRALAWLPIVVVAALSACGSSDDAPAQAPWKCGISTNPSDTDGSELCVCQRTTSDGPSNTTPLAAPQCPSVDEMCCILQDSQCTCLNQASLTHLGSCESNRAGSGQPATIVPSCPGS